MVIIRPIEIQSMGLSKIYDILDLIRLIKESLVDLESRGGTKIARISVKTRKEAVIHVQYEVFVLNNFARTSDVEKFPFSIP